VPDCAKSLWILGRLFGALVEGEPVPKSTRLRVERDGNDFLDYAVEGRGVFPAIATVSVRPVDYASAPRAHFEIRQARKYEFALFIADLE